LYMPLRTGIRPVKAAARLGVQEGSTYIRIKLMPSEARRFMFVYTLAKCVHILTLTGGHCHKR
jgi:hypothetical protein